MRIKLNLVFVFILALPFLGFSQVKQKELFSLKSASELNLKPQHASRLEKIKTNKVYKNFQLVKIAHIPDLTKENNGTLPIKLPGSNKTYVAFPTDFKYYSDDKYVWKGEFKHEDGYVTIICEDDMIYGTVQINDRFLEIRSFEPGKSIIYEYNEEELSKRHDTNQAISLEDDFKTVSKEASLKTLITSRAYIRALVLYTNAAANAVTNVHQTAQLAIQQVNNALINSELYDDLYVGYVGLVNLQFTETNSIVNDIKSLASINNTTVRSLRNTHSADVVILLTHGEYYDYSGIVSTIGPVSDSAFAIVEAVTATANQYVFAHELVHMFGGVHQNEPGTYEHGYNFDDDKYTIMYTQRPDWQSKILYYSNPDVDYQGDATGTSSTNDVARKIREEASTVEDFRSYLPSLSTYISGPGSGSGGTTYTWSANVTNGTSPYTYLWQKSLDGKNFTITLGTSSSVTTQLPLSDDLFLKLTVNSSDGQEAYDFHGVINLGGGLDVSTEIAEFDISSTKNLQVETINSNINTLQQTEFEIYPNPTRGGFKLNYYVNEACRVQIKLFDTNRGMTDILVDAFLQEGRHNSIINSRNLKAGIYLCKLTQKGASQTIKLIVK